MAKADESKEAIEAAVAAGMDPEIAKEMAEEGTLQSAPEGDKPATGEEGAGEHVDKPAEDGEPDGGDKGPKDGEPGAAGDDDKGKGDDDDQGQQPDRTVKHIPAWKAKEMEKAAAEKARAEAKAEFDAELQRISQKEGGATSEDVTKLAEEFGLKPEAAAAFLDRAADAIGKKLGIDDIRKNESERAERERELAEEAGFSKEWDSPTTQEAIAAAANGADVTAAVKEKVKELAYSSTYARYRLPDIIRLEAAQIFEAAATESRPAEMGRGGASRGKPVKSEAKNLDDISATDIESMSDEEFLKFSENLGGSGSRFTRTTLPKKEKGKR